MREPDPRVLTFLAIPVAIGLLLLWLILCLLILPAGLFKPEIVPISNTIFQIQIPIVESVMKTPVWLFSTILLLYIPAHELIHALCFPDRGLSDRTFIGFWPGTGFFYAHYEGAMSRERFLLVYTAPYMILSLLPFALMTGGRLLGWPLEIVLALAWLSLLNSLGAAGDWIGFGLILVQIPPKSNVRNRGWKTFWKPVHSHRGSGNTTRSRL